MGLSVVKEAKSKSVSPSRQRHAKYATRMRERGYRPRTLWLTDEQVKSVREFLAGRGLDPTPRPVPPAPSQSPTEQKTGSLEDVVLGILLGLVALAVISWFRS
jgi:hypothetical protein